MSNKQQRQHQLKKQAAVTEVMELVGWFQTRTEQLYERHTKIIQPPGTWERDRAKLATVFLKHFNIKLKELKDVDANEGEPSDKVGEEGKPVVQDVLRPGRKPQGVEADPGMVNGKTSNK